MSSTAEFSSIFEDYRRRCRRFLFIWLGGVLALALGIFLALHIPSAWPALGVAGAAWLLAVIAFGFRIARFICPRCGQPFSFSGNPLARQCSNCGLRRGTKGEHLARAALAGLFAIRYATARLPPVPFQISNSEIPNPAICYFLFAISRLSQKSKIKTPKCP